jgi:succinate-semialdehyde dehydrogenase/glutarate-semialdehyde dehydrogenase
MENVISPNTGLSIGQWHPDSPAQIDAALENLGRASEAIAIPADRMVLLQSIAVELNRQRPNLAAIITAEVGKTPSEALDEVDYAISFLTHAAASIQPAEEATSSSDRRLRIVPAGPALVITPYNDPLAGIVRKIAPAIAAGCPVIVKPSALGQLTAEALFVAIAAVNRTDVACLVNNPDRDVVHKLIADPRFRLLSFTGSTATGRVITAVAGLKRLVLELGGNNPFLVLEGADLDCAAADAVARKTRAAGQACSAPNRIYVVASLFSAFRDRFLDHLSAVTYGASDAGVNMGPVRSARDIHRLTMLAAGAPRFGLKSGSSPFAFAPTVLADDTPLRHVEAFGPLVSLCPAPSRQAALSLAQTEDQALVCYIYGDVNPAELAALRFGSLGINSTKIQGAEVPTGGFGSAGIGREGGLWGLREYLTTINEKWG